MADKITAGKITVLLADDHALVRKGFRRMLEDDRGITVAGEASDGNSPELPSIVSISRRIVQDFLLSRWRRPP